MARDCGGRRTHIAPPEPARTSARRVAQCALRPRPGRYIALYVLFSGRPPLVDGVAGSPSTHEASPPTTAITAEPDSTGSWPRPYAVTVTHLPSAALWPYLPPDHASSQRMTFRLAVRRRLYRLKNMDPCGRGVVATHRGQEVASGLLGVCEFGALGDADTVHVKFPTEPPGHGANPVAPAPGLAALAMHVRAVSRATTTHRASAEVDVGFVPAYAILTRPELDTQAVQ